MLKKLSSSIFFLIIFHVTSLYSKYHYVFIDEPNESGFTGTNDSETFAEYLERHKDYVEKIKKNNHGNPKEKEPERNFFNNSTTPQTSIQNPSELLPFHKEHFSKLIKYKYPLLISSSLILIYTYYRIKLSCRLKFLKKTTNWSSWKGNMLLDAFYKIPEEKLLTELSDAIYQRYQKDRSDGPIEPFYLFFTDIKKEIKHLEEFISLYHLLSLPIISWFFPNLDNELFLAEEKVEQLTYMEDVIQRKLISLNI